MSLGSQPRDGLVCVVTVTYGDRWQYLQRVLQAVAGDRQVGRIVVVDNGSSYDIALHLSSLNCNRISVVSMGDNAGSAAGYKAGIQRALEDPDSSLIWLLDDDNYPDPDALKRLVDAYGRLQGNYSPGQLAVLALREDRPQLVAMARGQSVKRAFPPRRSFLGFDIWQTVVRKFIRVWDTVYTSGGTTVDFAQIPWGIYGGLLFHRNLVRLIGYPDERFYLYGDDTDFTRRITQSGGAIYLVPPARITDLESSWHAVRRQSVSSFLRNCLEASETRIYYSMRNGAYVFQKYFHSDSLAYRLNRQFYMATLKFYLTAHNAPDRYDVLRQAIAEGEAGRLGRRAIVTGNNVQDLLAPSIELMKDSHEDRPD